MVIIIMIPSSILSSASDIDELSMTMILPTMQQMLDKDEKFRRKAF